MSWNNFFSSLILENRPTPLFEKTIFAYKAAPFIANLLCRALKESQFWPEIKVKKYQEEMVKKIIKHGEKNIPYWSKKLIHVTSIKDIGPMGKRDYHNLPVEIFSVKNYRQATLRGSTSGSTGIPLTFYNDPTSRLWRQALYKRVITWGGGQVSDLPLRFMNSERFGLDGVGKFFYCVGPENITQQKKNIFDVLGGNTVVLDGFASNLIFLAKIIEKEKPRLFVRFAISTAEMLTKETREYLEKVFRAPVFNCYTSRETGFIATECELHNGFHVHAENIFLEILDDMDNPVAPGQTGLITITTFDNHVMPFIRYQLGDIGSFITEPCPCGRTLPRIKFEGRNLASLLLPGGRVKHLFELIQPVMKRMQHIIQYQIVQKEVNEIVLKLVADKDLTQGIKAEIYCEIKELLGKDVRLSIEEVSGILPTSGGKQHHFISNLKN